MHLPAPPTVPRTARRVAAAVVLTTLGGCASLRSPSAEPPPLPVPAAWTTPADAAPADLSRWWDRFGDPLLASLVARALADASDVNAALARLHQARALRDVAAAGIGPSVGAGASVQASDAEGRSPTRQYRAGFDAGWEVDLWGARRAGVAAADADVTAAAASLGAARIAVAAEVAAAYVELRGAQARLVLAEAALASQQHTLRITQWREEAGLVNRLDVEQARTAVAQTRAQLPPLRALIVQSTHALAVLAGQPPQALRGELSAAAPVPLPGERFALALPAQVLRQRPDIAAAEARVRAAAARVDQADAQRLPSLQLSGSIGLNALSLGSLASGAGVASLLAAVNVPVFDGDRIASQVRAQEAALAEAQVGHRAAVLAALREVEDGLLALASAREQLANQRDAADAARRAAALAEQRYASGLVDFQNVLLSQRTLLAADDAVAATTAALATQHVRLYKALGGGWEADATDTDGPDANASR